MSTGPEYGQLDDHVHDEDELRLEDSPVWQRDNVMLTSVGLDVGSAGTQVVFSRLHLRRASDELSSRYRVVARHILHRSPVELTPYVDDRIDGGELGGIVDRAYAAARLDPGSVDTGVVILTGEALRRRNAKRITEVLAERAGDVVSASAGHHMEARLAAFGSGAVRTSYEQGTRILNIDIGGGTTKLAIADRGEVVGTAAIHIGGRLVVVDDDDRIIRLEPAGAAHAHRAGLTWSLGTRAPASDLAHVAGSMADDLLDMILGEGVRPRPDDLLLTAPLELGPIDAVHWSGGVAEYVYGREERDFRDLGPHLGRSLRERAHRLPGRQLPAGECIRATVMGASQYSLQMSGITSWIPDDAMLPRRNLRVLRPAYTLDEVVDPAAVADAVRRHLTAFDVARDDTDVMLALSFSGSPSHARLAAFARGLVDALAPRLEVGTGHNLALDGDVAMTLGRLLRDEFGVAGQLLVLDGLALADFDYVDLGRLRLPSRTVPVTVKSLVFSEPGTVSW